MSLDYAILGFLNYKPATGYDLKKIFDISIRHFWAADQSQIYRTLARLTENGLAELEVVEQTDRPDRKVYHITPKGRDALKEWIAGPFPSQSPHSGPLVQVFFAGMLNDEQILAKFQQASAVFRFMLDQYAQVPAQAEEYRGSMANDREYFFWMLTLEMGIKTMQAQLEWSEKVIQMLSDHQVPACPVFPAEVSNE